MQNNIGCCCDKHSLEAQDWTKPIKAPLIKVHYLRYEVVHLNFSFGMCKVSPIISDPILHF